jgi:DNA polymerase III sliding clamp (beta) subunit (PCNA family)
MPILKQALKTCNIRAKGKADSEFLISRKEGMLHILSMNEISEQKISFNCESIDSEEDFQFSINASSFYEFFNAFPQDAIQCVYDSENKTLVAGYKKIRMAFPTGDGGDFSFFQVVDNGEPFELPSELFLDCLKNTGFSVSQDWQSAPLTALKFKVTESSVTAESCDLNRISLFHKNIKLDIDKEYTFLLPKESVDILSTFQFSKTIKIHPCKKHFKIEWDNNTYISLLESSNIFPDLKTWSDKETIASIKVLRSELQNALKLSSLVAKDSFIKLESSDKLNILAADDSIGVFKHVIESDETYNECTTQVSHRSFLKLLDLFHNNKLLLEFKNINEDTYSVSITENGLTHLIFPVK